jgi:hypothetical protein
MASTMSSAAAGDGQAKIKRLTAVNSRNWVRMSPLRCLRVDFLDTSSIPRNTWIATALFDSKANIERMSDHYRHVSEKAARKASDG